MINGRIAVAVLMASALGMTSCEKASNAAESAGTAVNDAANATGKALDSAAQTTGEALDGAAQATGEALGGAAQATGEALGNAAKATSEGLDAAGEYLSRQDEVEISREAVVELKKKWAQLRDRTVTTNATAEAAFRKITEQMVQGLAEADEKLVAVEEASADAWQAAKSALDGALRKTQELYDQARARFGD